MAVELPRGTNAAYETETLNYEFLLNPLLSIVSGVLFGVLEEILLLFNCYYYFIPYFDGDYGLVYYFGVLNFSGERLFLSVELDLIV